MKFNSVIRILLVKANFNAEDYAYKCKKKTFKLNFKLKF